MKGGEGMVLHAVNPHHIGLSMMQNETSCVCRVGQYYQCVSLSAHDIASYFGGCIYVGSSVEQLCYHVHVSFFGSKMESIQSILQHTTWHKTDNNDGTNVQQSLSWINCRHKLKLWAVPDQNLQTFLIGVGPPQKKTPFLQHESLHGISAFPTSSDNIWPVSPQPHWFGTTSPVPTPCL